MFEPRQIFHLTRFPLSRNNLNYSRDLTFRFEPCIFTNNSKWALLKDR